jgi:hypothetical protein
VPAGRAAGVDGGGQDDHIGRMSRGDLEAMRALVERAEADPSQRRAGQVRGRRRLRYAGERQRTKDQETGNDDDAFHVRITLSAAVSRSTPALRPAADGGSPRARRVSFRMPLGISDPGRLQLDRSPGGVVHLRYRQAEPVPQAPEPFAAGPGKPTFPAAAGGRAQQSRGGAGRGGHIRHGRAAWALMIWCRMIPAHCGSPWGLGPGSAQVGHVAGFTVGSGGAVHPAGPGGSGWACVLLGQDWFCPVP